MSSARSLALVLLVAAFPARADDKSQVIYHGSIAGWYKATMLDLDLEGGGGFFWGNRTSGIGFGRVRSGIMFVKLPIAVAIGATFEVNNVSMATYGAQLELLHLETGVWGQLGPTVDGHGNFGGLLSVGWSLFGIEAQVRGYDEVRPSAFQGGYGFALVGKLRIPVGYILYVLSRK